MAESKLASALIAALADPDSAGDTSFLPERIERIRGEIKTAQFNSALSACPKFIVLYGKRNDDGQRSATDLEANVDLFMHGQGLYPMGGWTAKKSDDGRYLVSFDFHDGDDGEQQAVWEYDPTSHHVRYITVGYDATMGIKLGTFGGTVHAGDSLAFDAQGNIAWISTPGQAATVLVQIPALLPNSELCNPVRC